MSCILLAILVVHERHADAILGSDVHALAQEAY
jgi:hypothetical protein